MCWSEQINSYKFSNNLQRTIVLIIFSLSNFNSGLPSQISIEDPKRNEEYFHKIEIKSLMSSLSGVHGDTQSSSIKSSSSFQNPLPALVSSSFKQQDHHPQDNFKIYGTSANSLTRIESPTIAVGDNQKNEQRFTHLHISSHRSAQLPSIAVAHKIVDLGNAFVENRFYSNTSSEGLKESIYNTPMYFGTENSTVIATQIGASAHIPCTVHFIGDGVLFLTAEPIVVVGTSPADCSHMIQTLVSLIAPLEYCAESRPYLSIHDSEFKEFTRECGKVPPPLILGVTNPFSIKLLKEWPHMLRLVDNQVSWIRKKDYHLLTVGLTTYSSDERFSATHLKHSEDWTLQIKFVQQRDAGIYECQVSTHPPTSIFLHLLVVEARAEISGPPIRYLTPGSTLRLQCHVVQNTENSEYIFWYHDNRMINYDADRGINVSTEPDFQSSELTISRTRRDHSGNYTCVASNTQPASVLVHIFKGDNPAAMYHGHVGSSTISYQTHLLHIFLLIIAMSYRTYVKRKLFL